MPSSPHTKTKESRSPPETRHRKGKTELRMKSAPIIALLLWSLPILAQSTTGELRLTVTDPAGLALRTSVELVSQGNQYRHTFTTDDRGTLDAKRLPYGIYQ